MGKIAGFFGGGKKENKPVEKPEVQKEEPKKKGLWPF